MKGSIPFSSTIENQKPLERAAFLLQDGQVAGDGRPRLSSASYRAIMIGFSDYYGEYFCEPVTLGI